MRRREVSGQAQTGKPTFEDNRQGRKGGGEHSADSINNEKRSEKTFGPSSSSIREPPFIMSPPTTLPALTPQLCFNERAVRGKLASKKKKKKDGIGEADCSALLDW